MTATVNQTTRNISTVADLTALTVTSSAAFVQATETAVIAKINVIIDYLQHQNAASVETDVS